MTMIKQQFEVPAGTKKWAWGLIGVGLIALVVGIFTKAMSSDVQQQTDFWGTLIYNAIFWFLVVNATMFFICITTLAMGSWQISFRRVSEAISVAVPFFGIIVFVLLVYVVCIAHNARIYDWSVASIVNNDPILKGKSPFLNPTFFFIWTFLIVLLLSLLGYKMRKLSREADTDLLLGEKGKSFIYRNTVWASLFIVWFAITVGSTLPWLWIMSINSHWYSTMFSWYTFGSSFVSGVSLMALWVVYMKNKGYLEFTTEEHLHDIGKFMFAFSIFWTYLWFAQYMLTWYANIPEETIYFKNRVWGVYRGIFFFNLIINFVCPILLLMRRGIKRNFTLLSFIAVLILFGHWVDFYQMVMASLSPAKVSLGWFDFGILFLFVGLLIAIVSKALTKKPLIMVHHPFLKESIIHHT